MGIYIAIGAVGLIGVVMTFFAVKRLIETVVFIRTSQQTGGKVVSLSTSRNSDGKTMYMPVVEFTTGAEKKIRFTSTIAASPPSYQVGEIARVRYLSKNPQAAKIDSFAELWLVTLILSVIGVVCLAVAALLFRSTLH
jgi:hypothetical protein